MRTGCKRIVSLTFRSDRWWAILSCGHRHPANYRETTAGEYLFCAICRMATWEGGQ